MNVHLTLKSKNAKTGPIPVSTTSSDSCPPSCPLKDNGCYASAGGPLALHWRKVDRGERGMTWDAFCEAVEAFPEGQPWRANQAGDLPHKNGVIDKRLVTQLAVANMERRGWTYTHHDMSISKNLRLMWLCNELGFTVNLSANSLDHADALAYTKLPIVTVLPADQLENCKTPGGRQVVVCPAVVKDDVSCATCQLCYQRDRQSIVGFPAHGSGKKRVVKIYEERMSPEVVE